MVVVVGGVPGSGSPRGSPSYTGQRCVDACPCWWPSDVPVCGWRATSHFSTPQLRDIGAASNFRNYGEYCGGHPRTNFRRIFHSYLFLFWCNLFCAKLML